MRVRTIVALAAALGLAGLGPAGCGSEAATAEPAPAPASSGASFQIQDPWVKAADKGMTAAFATMVNNGPADVTVVKAESAVSPMELHEMAMADGKMVMRPKDGGLVVKAGATHKLEPGGDHLMMMNLAKPVKPGDEVAFKLTFADGTATEFTAVVKPFTGANESYSPGHG
jgi:copper(I)-binding protein